MKTKLLFIAILASLVTGCSTAQNRTIITSHNGEISDNLDLKAVASIFGESSSLQEFERKLNDPRLQLSNLDLNDDNQVDYIRVIESVENRTHVIILQAVLGRDMFQDVASIDVERDRYNNVSIQVVGDEFMYGPNYIYEPIYYSTPAIYASFWIGNYRPYYSRWNWNYYPSYYYTWNPFPVYRYRNNINNCINRYNSYRYVSYRHSYRAPILCAPRRHNAYERIHPEYSFSRRNHEVANRYELDQRRARYDRNPNNNKVNYTSDSNKKYNTTRIESSRRYADNSIHSNRNSNQKNEVIIPRGYDNNKVENTRKHNGNSSYNYNESNKRNEVNNNYNGRRNSDSRDYSSQRNEQRNEVSSEKSRRDAPNTYSRNESQSNKSRDNRRDYQRT